MALEAKSILHTCVSCSVWSLEDGLQQKSNNEPLGDINDPLESCPLIHSKDQWFSSGYLPCCLRQPL